MVGPYFEVGGVRYPAAGMDELTLSQLKRVQVEAGVTPARFERMWMGYSRLTPEERLDSIEHLELLSIQLWVSRLAAGERVGFEESQIPVGQLVDALHDDEPAAAEPVAEPDPTVPAPPVSGQGE